MKRKLMAVISTLVVLSMTLTACGGGKSSDTAATPESSDTANEEAAKEEGDTAAEGGKENIHFAMMLGVGGRGDNGYNDEVYEGCEMAVEQLGVTFDYCEPSDISEFETQLRAYADAGEYDVIMACSSEMADALEMVADDYPEQKFCMIDTSIEGHENIHCLTASHPEQHFLSGVLAGIVTLDDRFEYANDENKLGFCIAMDTPTSIAQASGFLAGAKYINPDVEIMTSYIGGYNDPATAKELATTMYERGADIVSVNAGGSSLGVFNAAEEQGKYVIGTSLGMVNGEHSLATSMKYVQQMVIAECRALQDGTWSARTDVYGIKDGVCNYSLEGVNTEIPQDIIDKIDEVKALTVDGTLVLPTTLDEVDAWAEENRRS